MKKILASSLLLLTTLIVVAFVSLQFPWRQEPLKFIRDNLEKTLTLSKLIQSVLTTLAIIWGGVWAYFNYFHGRTYKPRLEIGIQGDIDPSSGRESAILVTTEAALTRRRRIIFWQVMLLPTYALLCLAFLFASLFEVTEIGPYTRWFNERLKTRAEQERLVGGPADRVSAVLGRPDNVMEFWEAIGADGKPAPGAEYVTTYEYFPYPWLPASKFQVHTTQGIVRNLEMYDD